MRWHQVWPAVQINPPEAPAVQNCRSLHPHGQSCAQPQPPAAARASVQPRPGALTSSHGRCPPCSFRVADVGTTCCRSAQRRFGRAVRPILSKQASRVYTTSPSISSVDGPYSLKRQAHNATKGAPRRLPLSRFVGLPESRVPPPLPESRAWLPSSCLGLKAASLLT